jgi:dephospho-CoA kinase
MSRILIGITGGIGSGKSAVTAYLRRRGEQVICADEVAREVVLPGSRGAAVIQRQFGEEYFLPDGSLDRAKLAQLVFQEPESLKRLNAILHPIIIGTIWEKASQLPGRVFIDAALLIETGMHEKTDYVWLVTADRETRIARVMERDGTAREAVEKRMDSQTDDTQREKYADEVIYNRGGLDALHQRIDRLLRKREYNEVTIS